MSLGHKGMEGAMTTAKQAVQRVVKELKN